MVYETVSVEHVGWFLMAALRDHAQVGRFKTWLNRLQTYLSPMNFIMVLYLYIVQEPLGVIWQVWAVVLTLFLVLMLVVDIVLIFPSEQGYSTRKNPEWLEMREDVKKIKRRLEIEE